MHFLKIFDTDFHLFNFDIFFKMFYTDDELKDLVTCPRCDNRFSDPRILPCGNTICNDCIDSNDGCFACIICNSNHQIPNDGFIKNENTSKLLKKRPSEIYRGRKVEELNSLLNKLKSELKSLKDGMNDQEHKVSERLDSVISNIDTAAENAIEVIQNSRDILLKTINNHKEKILKSKKLEQSEITTLNELSEKMEEFHDKWESYLKKCKIDEDEISKAILEAKKTVNLIQKKNRDFESCIFNNQVMKFEPVKFSDEKNSIGSLTLYTQPGLDDIDNLKQLDLNLYIDKNNNILDFLLFPDGRILVIVGDTTTNNIIFTMFDHEYRLVSKNVFQIERPKNAIVENFGIIGTDVFFRYLKHTSSFSQICKVNCKIDSKNFKIDKEITFNGEIQDLSYNSSYVFVLNSELKLKSYDTNLKNLNILSHAIDKIVSDNYVSKMNCFLFTNDEHLFLYTPMVHVLVVKMHDWTFLNKIQMKRNIIKKDFCLTKDSTLIYSWDTELIFISYDGKRTNMNIIKNFKPHIIRENDNLYGFFDRINKKIYVK